MKCFKCGYELPPEALFCPHCGQNHDNTPHFCSKCGNPVDKSMKFCENCGAPIQNAEKKDEKKLECPELPVDDLMDVGIELIETLQEEPISHTQEIHNAKPVQRDATAPAETPAASEAPAAAGGSAGNAGQDIRRAPASVRDIAGQAQLSSAETAPVQNASMPLQQASRTDTQQAAPASQTVAPAQTAPIQSQTPVQPQVPTQSPISQPAQQIPAAQAVSAAASVASGVTRAAGSAAASVAAEVAHVAGAAAASGVKKAGSTAKTVAIWAAVAAFVIGAVTACLNFFVPAPEDTVDKLIESVEELKYDDMLSCFDSTTEKQMHAAMSLTSGLLGAVTGFDMDLEEFMAFAPSMAPYMEIPDLGIADAETVLYADCSKNKLMQYCETANAGGSIPNGYLFDNEIMNFLSEHNLTLPGLENLTAEAAVVKITLKDGSVGYLPLINEGWGDWRIPMMDLMISEGMG